MTSTPQEPEMDVVDFDHWNSHGTGDESSMSQLVRGHMASATPRLLRVHTDYPARVASIVGDVIGDSLPAHAHTVITINGKAFIRRLEK